MISSRHVKSSRLSMQARPFFSLKQKSVFCLRPFIVRLFFRDSCFVSFTNGISSIRSDASAWVTALRNHQQFSWSRTSIVTVLETGSARSGSACEKINCPSKKDHKGNGQSKTRISRNSTDLKKPPDFCLKANRQNGGAYGTRTRGLLHAKQALSQLS